MSGHVKNKSNQSIKHVNVIHSHLMRVLCEIKPELIDTKKFLGNEKKDTEKFKTDFIKNSVDRFVKNKFVGNMNFKNDVFKKYLKNIKSLTAIMKLIYSLFQEMK